jgi:glycosyltransferase involved in cell wall biosynthesis
LKINPLISVIIPVYNREVLVKSAIESVLNQSFTDFELIVVNDGSNDNTLATVESFNDPRLKVVTYSPNRGNATARNEGILKSQSDLITFLDSDDSFEPEFLEILFNKVIAKPDVDFFWTGVNFKSEDGSIIKKEFWNPIYPLPSDSFFYQLRIGTNNGLSFKRKVIKQVGGFDEDLEASVDRDFLLKISQYFKGESIEGYLINVLIGSHTSVRKNYPNQANAYNRIISKHKAKIEGVMSLKRWWYHKAMWLNLYSGNKKTAFEYLKNLDFSPKSSFLFLIFLLLPNDVARLVHKKLAGGGITGKN